MQFGKSFKNNLVLLAAVIAVCLVCISQSAFAGSIVGWGDNYYGQADPPAGTDFVAIAAGDYHSLALKSDSSIVGWGYNYYGQATPPAGSDYVAIAAGDYHSLALKSDGSIVGWGRDNSGQATPPAGNDYVAIAANGHHSLALESDSSIVGWGWDDYGQATPPPGSNYVGIAAGYYHSLAMLGVPPVLTLIDPNGGETLLTGRRYMITWQSQGYIDEVKIEYSSNNGSNWTKIATDPNNTGSYNWLVPEVTSDQCLVRISANSYGWIVSDESDSAFKIYECALPDVSGDCVIDLFDFALIASYWLECGDPFDPNCVQ